MRYSTSPTFARVQRAHAIAYTAYDAFAEAGQEHTMVGNAASTAEYEALDRMMTEPAQSPGDILAKLRIFLDREMYGWDGPRNPDASATYRGILENDLRSLMRPCVSAEMADAFERWADAWQAFHDAEYDSEDKLPFDVIHTESMAWGNVMSIPCSTPGDFLAKAYVDLLQDVGAWSDGFPFQIKGAFEQEEGVQDANAFLYDDLRNCDLGRCMLALGRIDFDAKAWIEATVAVGGQFKVMIDPSGRTFWQGMDPDNQTDHAKARHRMLQELIGGEFHVERTKAVCDLVEAHYPEHWVGTGVAKAKVDA